MHIEQNSALLIADEIKHTHETVDQALLQMSRLASTVIEVSATSKLTAAQSQPAIEAAVDSLRTFVTGRSRFVDAHRAMAVVKGRSNLREVDLGCGFDNPLMRGELPQDQMA